MTLLFNKYVRKFCRIPGQLTYIFFDIQAAVYFTLWDVSLLATMLSACSLVELQKYNISDQFRYTTDSYCIVCVHEH